MSAEPGLDQPLARNDVRQPPLGMVFGAITLMGALAVHWLHLDRLGVPMCYFKAMTGLPCVTCGGTRALGRLAVLDVWGALAMNPLVALGLLGLLAWAVADLLLWSRGRRLSLRLPSRAANAIRVAVVLGLVANWVYVILAGR